MPDHASFEDQWAHRHMCICYLNNRGAGWKNDNCGGLKIVKTTVLSSVLLCVRCNMGLTDLSQKWQDNKSTGASTTHDELHYKDLSQQPCGVDVARNAGDQR